jgi:hypothetical protein
VKDVDLEGLREHLYQVSLGKENPQNLDSITKVAKRLWPEAPIDEAASYAIALAELRQDLAAAEDNRHMHAATGLKRKIDLLDDLMLQCIERMRSSDAV